MAACLFYSSWCQMILLVSVLSSRVLPVNVLMSPHWTLKHFKIPIHEGMLYVPTHNISSNFDVSTNPFYQSKSFLQHCSFCKSYEMQVIQSLNFWDMENVEWVVWTTQVNLLKTQRWIFIFFKGGGVWWCKNILGDAHLYKNT